MKRKPTRLRIFAPLLALLVARCTDFDSYTLRDAAPGSSQGIADSGLDVPDADGSRDVDAHVVDASPDADGSRDADARVFDALPDANWPEPTPGWTVAAYLPFDTKDDVDRFTFWTPEFPFAPLSWEFGDNFQELYQASNVSGLITTVGTVALYAGDTYGDVRVSTTFWSTDPTGWLGVVARRGEDTRYYRLWLKPYGNGGVITNFHIRLFNGTDSVELAAREIDTHLNFLEPHTVTFEVVGANLRGYYDGQLMIETVDTTLTAGSVGVETQALGDGHFDDFVIEVPVTEVGTAPN